MRTFTFRSQFIFPSHSNPPKSHPIFTSTTLKSIQNTLPSPKTKFTPHPPKTNYLTINPILDSKFTSISKKPSRNELISDGYSRYVVLGALSLGFLMFLMGIDDGQKAMALGPEGSLMEKEFWDNMRRYGLYVLTVSTGALSAIFYPIFELLKNPITAILILVVLGGGFLYCYSSCFSHDRCY